MEIRVNLSGEDLRETLGGVLGTCYWTWSWWRGEEYAEGYDWDTYPEDPTEKFLTLTVSDPQADEWDAEDYEDKSVTKSLSVADILAAYMEFGSHPNGARILAQQDAQSGDAVLQQAMFGEIIYG